MPKITRHNNQQHKGKPHKVSLVCILNVVLAISMSLLLLVHRFHSQLTTIDQEGQSQEQQRRMNQQQQQLEYMKTGRKPKGMDPQYSERDIQKDNNEAEEEKEEEEDALLMPKHEKIFSAFAKIDKPNNKMINNNPLRPHKQKQKHPLLSPEVIPLPSKQKHSHFFQDPIQIQEGTPIHYLNLSQVSMQDTFSASWLQRRQEFLEMDLSKIMICEDAAWEAWKSRPDQLKMTMDYLDFSVEHLSKWWKFMTFYKTKIAEQTLWGRLEDYLKRGNGYPTVPEEQGGPILQETLCMIAFQPYLHKHQPEKHHALTVTSLAATIESIRRAQMGRVIVVGLVDNGHEIAQEAFRYLADRVPDIIHTQNARGVVTKIGQLEVAYARGSAELAWSKHLDKNIPRDVLYGTRLALQLADRPASSLKQNETDYVQEWLGTEHAPSYWKYLYLTEPDTLLQARLSSIPQLKAQLDQGYVLAPHRLQPIPHESDLRGLANKFRYLNEANGFDQVYELDPTDPQHDVCCDEYQGPDAKPGKTNYEDCGTWWYMCGFEKDFNDKSLGDVHKRLRPYQFMKLKQGTGLTLMSGNLFGRRCFPAKQGFCKPPAAR